MWQHFGVDELADGVTSDDDVNVPLSSIIPHLIATHVYHRDVHHAIADSLRDSAKALTLLQHRHREEKSKREQAIISAAVADAQAAKNP